MQYPLFSTANQRHRIADTMEHTRHFWASKPPKVFDSECVCGGGKFLGLLHSIAMYENHTTKHCDNYSEERSSPFLNKEYFKILQNFEDATKNINNGNYYEKIIDLLQAWEELKSVLSVIQCTSVNGIHVLMHYASSDSALIILSPTWKYVDKNIKNDLTDVLNSILIKLKKVNSNTSSIKICNFLLSLINNPWDHHFLSKILKGQASYDEVINFIQFESSNIYAMRLRILCLNKSEPEVLILSSMAVNIYNRHITNKQYFEERDYEFMRDVYYASLVYFKKKPEVLNHLAEYSPHDTNVLLKSYIYKIQDLSRLPIEIRPPIIKCLVSATEMVSCTLVAKSITNSYIFNDYSYILKSWSNLIITLMQSDLIFSMRDLRLIEMIYKFVELAPTAGHIYKICDILNEEFNSKLPQSTLIHVYTKALCVNINEKEKCKLISDSAGSLDALKKLVQGYLKLANHLKDIFSVCRECILTAYSLMPSSDLLTRIEQLAIKNDKLSSTDVAENVCNEHTEVSTLSVKLINSDKRGRKPKFKACKSDQKPYKNSYTKIHYDLSNLPYPLSSNEIDDLIAVLKYPRFTKFNWDIDWAKVKIICKQYLENLDIVINRNMLKPSDLQYLNMDIEEYNNWRECEIRKITNDKGYFSSEQSDESTFSAASSGEILCYSEKHSKISSRKRKVVRKRKQKKGGDSQKSVKRKKTSHTKSPNVEGLIEPEPVESNIKLVNKRIEQNECQVEQKKDLPKRRCLRSQKKSAKNKVSIVDRWLLNEPQLEVENNEVEEDDSVSNVNLNAQNVKLNKKSKQQRMRRNKRTINKNQHNDYDYSWYKKKQKSNESNNSSIRDEFVSDTNNELNNKKQIKKPSKTLHLKNNTDFELPHSSQEHLNMLSARIPQLNSLQFLRPVNTDQIINVVQIQTTSNTLTNVTQTQTEHVANNHSNDGIEKKSNDNQSNTHSLDNFVSVYQSNTLNNSINSIQNSGSHQGECSFTGFTTDSITNVHNIGQQEIGKPIETHDRNQINLDHRRWNDIHLQNSSERLQSTIENTVHLSSNVIVRTSDINPNNITQTSGQITNIVKKPYCIKTRDRFVDLSLPGSISSISTNSNRSTNISQVISSNKSNFDSKCQQSSPVQTSVGSQVNFNNEKSESIQNMISQNNLPSKKCTNINENSNSTNVSILNDQISTTNSKISTTSITNTTSFIKQNNSFDNLKSNVSNVNPISSIQTQTCIGLRPSKEISNPNTSVISLMITSTQSQVIKPNVHNSLYTSSQSQRVQLSDSQINRSDEQKKIDNLKLISQTFTATSEAIKFVTSNTESQRLIQSTEKNNTSNLAIFQNTIDGISNISQENDLSSKSLNRGRGNMRTYESKTRALKQANMSDMFVFEKGTLYAVQDDVNQMESTKSVISSKNNTVTNVRVQNKQAESVEKPKLSPTASPNITITGSMLPRFQQVFGKTKFPSSTVVNDVSSICSTSVANNSLNPGSVVNRTNISTSRVYSSSKGVQTNHDIGSINSNTLNCISSKVAENKSLLNSSMSKASSVMAIGNNKNNVIMTCKTVSSMKNIPQVSASSTHQLTTNIDKNIGKKELTSMPISKVPTTFTTVCNNSSIASSSSNVIYTIPIQSDSKSNSIIEKHLSGVTQVQKQLKVSPSIIQSVLRKHPTWQNNSFRQGKQSTEVQTSSTLIASNIVKTTIESSNNKVLVNINKPNVTEQNVSSSMMEQVREFESVLEEVRKTSLMNEMSTANMLPQINHEIIQIHSPTENVDLLNTDNDQTLFPLNKKLNVNNERERCSFSFLNQTLSNNLASEDKESVTAPTAVISVRSSTPTPQATSPNNVLVNPVDGSTQCSKQIVNKAKPVIKTPASSPSTSAVKVPVLQKPLPKLQEDEQTTQRIYAILDKYAEQLRNSPELKNKPAPRRRTNPPTNPSLNAKRKKSNQLNLKTCSQQTSCSSSGMEMSPTSDMHAIDSEDSSNAVSHFSHIINSPSRNSDELNTATVISDTPLNENALINVNDVIKKINVDTEIKSKVSQTTQIVVSGTSGSFLSIPEGSAGNVRLLVAAGKNQKMYRLHCPVAGQGPVLFHQITTKDSCTNDVKISSLQNINESTILSALTTDDLQTHTGLGNEILLNTSKKSAVFEHKINKTDIISESLRKAQVLDNNGKQLPFPIMKKSQACQSTFSVIHSLPCNPKSESIDNIELLSETQHNISENIKKNYCDNEQTILNIQQEPIKNSNISIQQEKSNKTLEDEQHFIPSESSESISFGDMEFPSFHSQELKQDNNEDSSTISRKNSQQNITIINENKFEKKINQISVDGMNDDKISNKPNNLREGCTNVEREELSNVTIENASDFSNSKKEEENKKNLNNVAAASAAEIISTANQSSNTYKQKEELSSKIGKTECESENENENTLSNTVYNMLDNQSATIMNTKIGSLIFRLINDRSAKNWNSCLSKIMPPGTEKMMEGENLKQLQESFQHATIKTFKDLKIFVFEQCKKFDNNVQKQKEYDLYDDIDGLGVDKPSTNELFPEVAILNDLDKSVSPTLGLLQASTSKLNDTTTLQARRKSVLSHTTTSIMPGTEQTTHVVNKKNKTKVSFLKQALYNEMNQDSNDYETKMFINGNNKTILDAIEQIDSSPESPSNTNAIDSETCMSEDSTSTISSGTPHYNFRKSKRKNIEEDGFIESQVIKRMYRGRASEDIEEKSEIPKINNTKVNITEQKQTAEKKESNNRRISSRLKNSNVKNNQHIQHASNKSPQIDSSPYRITTTRTSLRRISRKTT